MKESEGDEKERQNIERIHEMVHDKFYTFIINVVGIS